MKRPNLQGLPSEVLAYIESLEALITSDAAAEHAVDSISPSLDSTEYRPVATLLLIFNGNKALRRPIGTYLRQHRAGMGQTDIYKEPPLFAGVFPEGSTILLFTHNTKVYKVDLARLPVDELFDLGGFFSFTDLADSDDFCAAIAVAAQGSVACLSKRGYLRVLRHHLFGSAMKQGMSFFGPDLHEEFAAANWVKPDDEVLCATKSGLAIRFQVGILPPQGKIAIQIGESDEAVGITPVETTDKVWAIGANGYGSQRSMEGFAPNKSCGGLGKLLIKNSSLIAIGRSNAVEEDMFILSSGGKTIRFPAEEISSSPNPMQGVICMTFRSDEAAAAFTTSRK